MNDVLVLKFIVTKENQLIWQEYRREYVKFWKLDIKDKFGLQFCEYLSLHRSYLGYFELRKLQKMKVENFLNSGKARINPILGKRGAYLDMMDIR